MGLILPRNPLGFPGGTAAVGLAHPMAQGARYAGVAAPGGVFIDLLTAAAGVQTGGALSTKVWPIIGPGVVMTTTGRYNAIANSYADSPDAVTMAAIFTYTTTTIAANILFNTEATSTSKVWLAVNGLTRALEYSNNSTVQGLASLPVLTLGNPYFLACSFTNGKVNAVLTDLLTGRISTSTTSATAPVIGTATWSVGCSGSNNQPNSTIAAVAYSTGRLLTLAELQAWAQAPWDYWYSPSVRQQISASVKPLPTVWATMNGTASVSFGSGHSLLAQGRGSAAFTARSTAAVRANMDGVGSFAPTFGNIVGRAAFMDGVGSFVPIITPANGWLLSDGNASAIFSVGFTDTLTSGVKVPQSFVTAVGPTLSQSLSLSQSDAQAYKWGRTIAQAMHLGFAQSQRATYHTTHTDIIRLALALGVVHPATLLTQAITLHSAMTPRLALSLTGAVSVSDTDILKAIYRGDHLLDGVVMTGLYVAPDGAVTTWAINTRTNAITEYTNYNFNSFAPFGLTYVAAGADGIYELTGDSDDGDSIVADVISGYTQMAQGKLSGVKGVYLAVRGQGQYFLKVIAGDGREYTYQAVGQPGMMTTKVNVGKGLRTRYIAFELLSTGQDFSLDDLTFIPMLSDRRI